MSPSRLGPCPPQGCTAPAVVVCLFLESSKHLTSSHLSNMCALYLPCLRRCGKEACPRPYLAVSVPGLRGQLRNNRILSLTAQRGVRAPSHVKSVTGRCAPCSVAICGCCFQRRGSAGADHGGHSAQGQGRSSPWVASCYNTCTFSLLFLQLT